MLNKNMKLWIKSVQMAKNSRNTGVKRFQILKGPLLKDAQMIYCALLFMDAQ